MKVRGARPALLVLGAAALAVSATACAASVLGGNGKDNLAPMVDMLQGAGYQVTSSGTVGTQDDARYNETLTGTAAVGAEITALLKQDNWVIHTDHGTWPNETWHIVPTQAYYRGMWERNGKFHPPIYTPKAGAATSLDPDKAQGTFGEDDSFTIKAVPASGGTVSIKLSYYAPGMP